MDEAKRQRLEGFVRRMLDLAMMILHELHPPPQDDSDLDYLFGPGPNPCRELHSASPHFDPV